MLRLPLAASILLLSGIGALSSVALAVDTNTGKVVVVVDPSSVNSDDAAFVHGALAGCLAEVKASELAVKRLPAGADHDFAQKVLDGHIAVSKELSGIAATKGVPAPTMLDEKAQKAYDELAATTDLTFAKTYIDGQVTAHKEALVAFKAASADAKDLDVKSFATRTMAPIQMHLEEAMQLAKNH